MLRGTKRWLPSSEKKKRNEHMRVLKALKKGEKSSD
jgi:hypothetical protein